MTKPQASVGRDEDGVSGPAQIVDPSTRTSRPPIRQVALRRLLIANKSPTETMQGIGRALDTTRMRSWQWTAVITVTAAVRIIAALQTAVPARDGAHYLWMAERVADGELGAAFATVFHPIYSLLVGGVLAPLAGTDVFAVAQVAGVVVGTLAVLPLAALAAHLAGATAGLATGLLYGFGIWFARFPADALSETVFVGLVATITWLLVARPTRCACWVGGLAGLAFGTRPEGALLGVLAPAWLWWRAGLRPALSSAALFVITALPWPIGWAIYGGGFTWTPKAQFNYAVGIGESDSGLQHYIGHLLQLPGELLDVVGFAAVPLAMIGAVALWQRGSRGVAALLLAPIAIQALVIPLLRSHFRFLAGYGVLLLVLAGVGLVAMAPHWRRWPHAARIALVVLAFAPDLVRLAQPRRHDRTVLRDLGTWLRPAVERGSTIITDMPRLEFYAGQKPGPPRPLTAAELIEAAQGPTAHWLVVVPNRSGIDPDAVRRAGFEATLLPPPLAQQAEARGLKVYQRHAPNGDGSSSPKSNR